MKQSRIKINKLISLLLIIALVLLPITGCSKKQDDSPKLKNVKIAKANKSSISIAVEYAGKVAPIEEVTIASKLPGKVELVNADVGTEVQKDDLLFKLDTKTTNAQLSQSKAAVDNAKANLIRTTDSSVAQQTTQLEAATQQAQLQYDDAKLMLERVQELYAVEAVSKEQLENATTYFKNAEVQLTTAKDNLRILKLKAAPQTAAIASAQLEQAQAAYETASIQVNDSTVTSPINGVVSMRNIDEGEFVGSGIPAFTVMNAKTVVVTINIPDTIVGKLNKNDQVPIKITALPNNEFTGIIDSISPAADARTQAYTVKLKLENPDNVIKPGMLAKAALPIENKDNIIAVPNEALFIEDGIQYVFLVEAGKVKKVSVSIGLSNDRITEITEGLSEGAEIITEGQSFLNDGEKVSIIK